MSKSAAESPDALGLFGQDLWGSPHAWAGGEDLEGICADFVGPLDSCGRAAASREMDANALGGRDHPQSLNGGEPGLRWQAGWRRLAKDWKLSARSGPAGLWAAMILNMRTVVTGEWLWDGNTLVPEPVVEIEDGRVTGIWPLAEREIPSDARRLDYAGATLAPSFLDVHIHGAAGHDVMEATPAAMAAVSQFLATRGTANFLATTVTASIDTTLRSLEGLAQLIDQAAGEDYVTARPLGIHLEGPFLSHAKRGVHPIPYLLSPDIAVFDRFFEAAEGHVRLLTLAPELPGGSELAAHATKRGVRVSLGHSNATAAETREAIAAGATSATHTFNAMASA